MNYQVKTISCLTKIISKIIFLKISLICMKKNKSQLNLMLIKITFDYYKY
jgi:hypothetical protein